MNTSGLVENCFGSYLTSERQERDLSPPQRLLLVNTNEWKKREAGALEREGGSARGERALIFPSTQPPRVSTQRDYRRPLRRSTAVKRLRQFFV